MIVETVERNGSPVVVWQEVHTSSPRYGRGWAYIAIGIVLAAVTLPVAVLTLYGRFVENYNVKGLGISLAVGGVFFLAAIWEWHSQTRDVMWGPLVGDRRAMYRVYRYDCVAFIEQGEAGRTTFRVLKNGGTAATFDLNKLRGFAVQSMAEYDAPPNPHWPIAFVIVADLGNGATELIAHHAGGRQELGQLLSHLIETFLNRRPATFPSGQAGVTSSAAIVVTATWENQSTGKRRRNDVI